MISQNLQYSGIAVTPKIGNQWVLTNSIIRIAVWCYVYKMHFQIDLERPFFDIISFLLKRQKVTTNGFIINNATLKYDCSFISLFLMSHVILKKKRLFKFKHYFRT